MKAKRHDTEEAVVAEAPAERIFPPLSAEEAAAWDLLVENGRKIREKQAEEQPKRLEGKPEWVKKMLTKKKRDDLGEVPVQVKRWVVCRMAGISFKKAGLASGATWLEVQAARSKSEAFRCALAAQEENSRQLMKAKAQSVVELSQDEDAKVSIAQTQVSMRILECLDRSAFGMDNRVKDVADEVKKAVGGGGFVINLVGDAAKVAEAAPQKKPAKALVYAEV